MAPKYEIQPLNNFVLWSIDMLNSTQSICVDLQKFSAWMNSMRYFFHSTMGHRQRLVNLAAGCIYIDSAHLRQHHATCSTWTNGCILSEQYVLFSGRLLCVHRAKYSCTEPFNILYDIKYIYEFILSLVGIVCIFGIVSTIFQILREFYPIFGSLNWQTDILSKIYSIHQFVQLYSINSTKFAA